MRLRQCERIVTAVALTLDHLSLTMYTCKVGTMNIINWIYCFTVTVNPSVFISFFNVRDFGQEQLSMAHMRCAKLLDYRFMQ